MVIQFLSYSGGTGMDSTKNVSGHVTPNLCFGIWSHMQVT
jgi:hypothetical protein